MKILVQVIIDHENGDPAIIKPIAEFRREDLSLGTLGLTIGESKLLLKNVQSELVSHQVEQYIFKHKTCNQCHKELKVKGYTEIAYRTLFGKLKLSNPRLYECSCNKESKKKSFSLLSAILPERIAPELQYLQAKWSSLVSYGMTSNILEDVLPMYANVSSIFYSTHKVAKRLDAEISEEKHCLISGCENEWNKLPHPNSPLTIGIDGGYIHAREGSNRKAGWFEAIIGKSLHETHPSKRFGFVCKYDDKPKSRLNTMLLKQGFQMNQDIVFLSDGGDTVRDLQQNIAPYSEHLLDWFHITMRITVMKQMVSGLLPGNYRDQLDKQLESIKWNIWHGNVNKALDKISSFSDDCYEEKLDKDSKKHKLWKYVDEFYTYIKSNRYYITNYAERYRYGEIISTSFVESAVNEVISKRMVKKQQMRWTQEGAHRMIQVRTATLNNELVDEFYRWYPSMNNANNNQLLQNSA
ncbi:MAG: ISKra4 family transposase [Rickettsiaceae bacterium]|nr:ISKra4 family transposase [Rickettsiaceae bacterium]